MKAHNHRLPKEQQMQTGRRGVGLITGALSSGEVGPFQLQAAIAAVHAEAPSTAATDWREITALYELLERIAPNPVFTLNRAVAVAMFRGPSPALELLAEVERDPHASSSPRSILATRRPSRSPARWG